MRSTEQNVPDSVIGRSVAILDCFESGGGHLGITEIAARTGLAKGTVHRLVGQLAAERILDRTADGRVTLGVRLFELGARVPLPRTLAHAESAPQNASAGVV